MKKCFGVPKIWPALKTMFFDDEDRLWISTIVNDQDIYEWWIMEKSGKVIAKFEWPRRKRLVTVRNGFLYTQEQESESSEYFILRYKMIFSD